MNISQIKEFITTNFKFSIEKLKNVRINKEKRSILIELIGNILNAGINISIRALAKILSESRILIKDIINCFKKPKLKDKKETRGRKNIIENFPDIIKNIKEICEKFEVVDKKLTR